MSSTKTPDWTEQDLEICGKYDEKVAKGEVTFRRIR
jgi:hypothetical protein